ncbi:MAG: DnaJ domain-containing protein [Maribacter sp.]
MKNYYQILTVERSDSSATIKRVFRKLALEQHPDISDLPDAHDRFIELNEAYEVLRNPVKRKRYNSLLDAKIEKKRNLNRSAKKTKKRTSSVQSSASKGKRRGEKYASETGKNFKKRTDSWASSFLFDVVIEITFRAVGALLETLFRG